MLDLITTEDLLKEIAKRQDAKDITYLFALASDDGESWRIEHNFDDEQIEDLCDLLKEDEGWEFSDE